MQVQKTNKKADDWELVILHGNSNEFLNILITKRNIIFQNLNFEREIDKNNITDVDIEQSIEEYKHAEKNEFKDYKRNLDFEIIDSLQSLLRMNYLLIGAQNFRKLKTNSLMIELKFKSSPLKAFKFPCLVVKEIRPKIIISSRRLVEAYFQSEFQLQLKSHLEPVFFIPVQSKLHHYTPGMRIGDSPKCLNVHFWDANQQKSSKLNMFFANFDIEKIRTIIVKKIQKIAILPNSAEEELESLFLFSGKTIKLRIDFHEIQEPTFREFLLKNDILGFMICLSYIPEDQHL